jgi:dolichyl-phosphate-mannose-protein mannosyltransferase
VFLFLARVGRAFESFASSPLHVIFGFSVIYFVPTVWNAAHKLIWDDEFFTLYISCAPGWHEIIRALSTGADQHPPTFYFLTHLFLKAFGTTHVTLRLPEILGFWAMCVLLYVFVKRLLGRGAWGVLAMLLPCAFGGMYRYADEARGYALLLAFSTLALLSWTRAVEDSRRRLFLPLLACGLAAAVASHYYAVLVALALGLAELVRTFARRKVDWPIWLAFTATIVPLIIFLPVIRSSQKYSGHFWAHPQWRMVLAFHPRMMEYFPNVLIGTIAFSLWLMSRRFWTRDEEEVRPRLSLPIIAALISFSLIPCFGVMLAKTITHAYVDRYAIAGAIGACILCTCLLHRLSDKRGLVVLVSVALSLGSYGLGASLRAIDNSGTLADLRADRRFLTRKAGDRPLVVDEVTVFHRLSFYGAPAFANRLAYIADADASTKYLGHDTIDRGLLALRPWFPINVVPASNYVRMHSSFLVFGYVGDWTWVTYELAKPGMDTKLLGRRGARLLFWVRDAAAVSEDPDANGSRDKVPSLYSKFEGRSKSLCAIYMGSDNCPSL